MKGDVKICKCGKHSFSQAAAYRRMNKYPDITRVYQCDEDETVYHLTSKGESKKYKKRKVSVSAIAKRLKELMKMKITEKLIRDELGLSKQKDLEGRPYFWFEGIGHFYYHEEDAYYFRADEHEVISNGVYAQNIYTEWDSFKKLFL